MGFLFRHRANPDPFGAIFLMDEHQELPEEFPDGRASRGEQEQEEQDWR
jgi:hypothetical protein